MSVVCLAKCHVSAEGRGRRLLLVCHGNSVDIAKGIRTVFADYSAKCFGEGNSRLDWEDIGERRKSDTIRVTFSASQKDSRYSGSNEYRGWASGILRRLFCPNFTGIS